ncbi:MAG TPA: hypothetical protein VMU93_04545 [Caulobacteraceae bacterium]|nr:hypothetical protein [Caulobacteraceae bacterium]
MFEFGRELRRLLGAPRGVSTIKDGLTGGDAPLLELIDLRMLRAEAQAADVAAGRISAKDRPRRLLEAAIVWREYARRSADAAALRKAAADAERAAEAYRGCHRQQGWARARLEQGRAALVGAELFGDRGLEAAAERAAQEAGRAGGVAAVLAGAMLAEVAARRSTTAGEINQVRIAATAFNEPIALLETAGRREAMLKLAGAEARLARAQLFAGAGLRLHDEGLLRAAAGDLSAAAERLDGAYEPLTLSRVALARGAAKAALAELRGDIAGLAEAVGELAGELDGLGRDHSPLDWARGQAALGQALSQLGEVTASEAAFAKSIACYDRADLVLQGANGVLLRAEVASGRGLAFARCAELTGDLNCLDRAEAAFKAELAAAPHRTDPVAWAMLQVQLGQVYAARLKLAGENAGERASAALAFRAALEVFAESGLRSLAAVAADGLELLATAKVD